jgi:hypothetical protein
MESHSEGARENLGLYRFEGYRYLGTQQVSQLRTNLKRIEHVLGKHEWVQVECHSVEHHFQYSVDFQDCSQE